MSPQEAISLLTEIEGGYPVNEWTVDNTGIWPLIRSQLSYHLLQFGATPSAASSRVARAIDHAGRILDSVLTPLLDSDHNLPRTAAADAFCLSYSSARQARLGGRHFDIRFGPVIEMLRRRNRTSHCWEFSFMEKYRRPRFSPTYPIQGELYRLYLRQALFPPKLREVNLPRYDDLLRNLASRQALPAALDRTRLLRQSAYILALRDRFDRALQAVNPSVAFTANAGPYDFALHLACRRRGIPSVELQHGAQGPMHGQYASWTKVPEDGYHMLPRQYWSWDSEAADTINLWSSYCKPHHRAMVTGVPWFDYSASMKPEQLVPGLAAQLRRPEGRKRGLIALQPPDKLGSDAQLIPPFVLEALEKLGKSWTWWIRLHPTMGSDLAPMRSLLRGKAIDAELEVARDVPLFFLLRSTDLHLTHSSTTVTDSGLFGVPSVVWSDFGASFFPKAVREGWCGVGTTTPALVEAIERLTKRGGPAPQQPSHDLEPALEAVLQEGDTMRDAAARKQR